MFCFNIIYFEIIFFLYIMYIPCVSLFNKKGDPANRVFPKLRMRMLAYGLNRRAN